MSFELVRPTARHRDQVLAERKQEVARRADQEGDSLFWILLPGKALGFAVAVLPASTRGSLPSLHRKTATCCQPLGSWGPGAGVVAGTSLISAFPKVRVTAGWAAAACFLRARVADAFLAAALRTRVFAAFLPAARCLRVAAAFFPADLAFGLISRLRRDSYFGCALGLKFSPDARGVSRC